MPGTAGGAGLADDREGDVLCGDAGRELTIDGHPHVLGLLLDQRLGGQHVLDLGRADAMCQRAERAVRRGMAVAADDGHAGEGETLLRADDVDDALALIELVEVLDAELACVLGHRLDLQAAFGIVDAVGAVGCRHVVIDDGERPLGMADLALVHPQAFEGLGARHFVDEVAVNVEERRAVGVVRDQMVVPDLVVEGLRRAHWAIPAEMLGNPGVLGLYRPAGQANRSRRRGCA